MSRWLEPLADFDFIKAVGAWDGLHLIDIVASYAETMVKKAPAVKMPTQNILFYKSTDLSSITWTGGNKINLVRDLAAVNRHNMAHTTSKGVPLVYRVAVTMMARVTTADKNQIFVEDPNLIQVAEFHTAPNTWVTRNAFVKAHAARESMFKLQGVSKSDRGAYSRTIRPTWDADADTFLTPQKGDISGGQDYVMGNWDYSALKQDDADLTYLRTVGDTGVLSLYLDSRRQVSADSNSESDTEDQPVDDNILNKLLSPTLGISSKDGDVVALARDEQDNPPYSLDNNGDHTDMVLAGRQYIGSQAGLTSTAVYDIPLGLFEFKGLNGYVDTGAGIVRGFDLKIELLGVYPM